MHYADDFIVIDDITPNLNNAILERFGLTADHITQVYNLISEILGGRYDREFVSSMIVAICHRLEQSSARPIRSWSTSTWGFFVLCEVIGEEAADEWYQGVE